MCRLFAHKQALAATANALLLQKCLKQKMWDNCSAECMQLPGVGKQTSKALAAAKLSKLRQLEAADPRKIEAVTQRHYPFGGSSICASFAFLHVRCCCGFMSKLQDTSMIGGSRCENAIGQASFV